MNLGTLAITDTIIMHNSSYGTGGGILNADVLDMSNSTVSNNTTGQGWSSARSFVIGPP